ncbi:MAG: glycosyltransferase family 4 protein [Acidimicrobiales bacterium]
MTERNNDRSSRGTDAEHPVEVAPLVLHVIPTRRARGAQREARALADQLDRPGIRRHRVLSLFDGPGDVVTDLALDHPGGDNPAVGFDPRLMLALRRFLLHLAPTLVVAHGSEPLKYLVPALAGRRQPLVYYAIGTYSGSGRRLQLDLWRSLVRRADLVAAEGEEVADECVERFGVPSDRVQLAPNGRDPAVFHPAPNPVRTAPPLLTFVGALTPGKRPDKFVELAAVLRSRNAVFQAEVIGDGVLRDELREPARAARVELVGLRQDVAERLRGADVFIFPSAPAGEGMPGVLIEAGLSGLPTVATAVPGVASIVKDGETGFVVEVDDVDAMAAATEMLLADPDLRSKMGRAAREHCLAHFSLDAVAARWLSLLEPLLESPRARGRAA